MSSSKTLLVVSYSQSGHTRQMCEAVLAGARHEDIALVQVVHRDALEAQASDVMNADAIIIGSPENFGYMSGAIKLFFDRIYYPCLHHTEGLPYALFIRAGNDGNGARTSIERIVTGLSWRQVHEPVIAAGEFSDQTPDECEQLGMTVAAALESGLI